MGMHRFDVSSSFTSASRFEPERKRTQKISVKSFAQNLIAKVDNFVAGLFGQPALALA